MATIASDDRLFGSLDSWGVGPSGRGISAYSEKYPTSISRMTLPGHGERGAGCGSRGLQTCASCGEVFEHRSSCMQRECPSCYRKWAALEGKRAAWRLWASARKIAQASGVRHWRILHSVESFRADGYSIRRARARAYRVAKKHGLDGGASVFHAFRTEDGHYVPDGYYHYHLFALATGDVVPGGQPEDGDILFKVLPDARHHDFNGFRSPWELAKAITYALSHASLVSSDEDADGTRHSRHAIAWFGVVSYNRMSTRTLKLAYPEGYASMHERQGVRCPSCGSHDTYQSGEFLPDGSVSLVTRRSRGEYSYERWPEVRDGLRHSSLRGVVLGSEDPPDAS